MSLKGKKVMILGIDGYLGWPLALWLGQQGCEVSGVDNFNRRDWAKEKGAHTIVPISRMTERLKAARQHLSIDINFREIDLLDRSHLREFIDEVKPDAIVHYAECPSAPFSMVDDEHAILVQKNNTLGTLGLLFAMRDLVPNSPLIKLGTMGEYGTPKSGRPIFEGIFPEDAILKYKDKEWSLGGELTPRDPGSFYHVSKVQDTANVFAACKFWGLRSYDVMQGVIYGVHTEQLAVDPQLRTRFDVDEWFGTVINRFVSQAIIGIPLTVYGTGEQRRGFISLQDAMQCMTRLIESPPDPGKYEVVNQMSESYSILELAKLVQKIGSQEFQLPISIQRLENPRVEAPKHEFNAVYDRLPTEFGFEPQGSLEEEVKKIFQLLLQPEIRDRIEAKKHAILPVTQWSGKKAEMEVLEVIKSEPTVQKTQRI